MISRAPKMQQPPRVVPDSANTMRKRGQAFRLRRELEAMEFVRQNTSIPIPVVIDKYLPPQDEKEGWFLMDRLEGSPMSEDSWRAMSEHARAQALSRLKSYFKQLHSLHPQQPGWIGSCSKGPAYDHRLNNLSTCGPFASVSAFHDFLVAPVKKSPQPGWAAKYRSKLRDDHGIVFVHADISWENILIDASTGNITGILDWEMAGYWPEWWEYRKALFASRSQPWWMDIMNKIMRRYPEETDTDMDLEMY